MAIHESNFQTGISWIRESLALFKQKPSQSLTLGLAYITLFVILPAIPFFSPISILIGPCFLVIAMSFYRGTDTQQAFTFAEILQQIKLKLPLLIGLGGICLIYALLATFIFGGDIQSVMKIATSTDNPTQILQLLAPKLLKLSLLLIPLMMATWFAPMLLAYNHYGLLHAIKSSIAGSIQYMVAMGVAWLGLTLMIFIVIMAIGVIAGLIGLIIPKLAIFVVSLALFASLLTASSLMLAFQYISYRDVFRAAPLNK